MKNLTLTAALLSLVASLFATVSVSASEQELAAIDTGAVVVYRPHQLRSARVTVGVIADGAASRLKANDSIELRLAPGTHTIAANMRGSDPVVIYVTEGSTTFIQTAMKKVGGHYEAMFSEVSSETAMTEMPGLRKLFSNEESIASR